MSDQRARSTYLTRGWQAEGLGYVTLARRAHRPQAARKCLCAQPQLLPCCIVFGYQPPAPGLGLMSGRGKQENIMIRRVWGMKDEQELRLPLVRCPV